MLDYLIDKQKFEIPLMLECSVNGSASLGELLGNKNGNTVRITFTKEERTAINSFVKVPLAYDLHKMAPGEDLQEMARDCENLRKELWEYEA